MRADEIWFPLTRSLSFSSLHLRLITERDLTLCDSLQRKIKHAWKYQSFVGIAESSTWHKPSPWEHAACSRWELFYNHVVCTRFKCVYIQCAKVLVLEVRGHSPLLGQVVWRVVWLEVNPLACGEVQSVQICAVNVACCPSKHIQEAIYNGHRLHQKKWFTSVSLGLFAIGKWKTMADYQFCIRCITCMYWDVHGSLFLPRMRI